jgi:hypothetical protein
MTPHDINETTVPTIALSAQYLSRFWHLSPRCWIGDEFYSMRSMLFKSTSPKSHNKFHIFPDSIMCIAARGEHCITAKNTKGTRNNEIAAEPI